MRLPVWAVFGAAAAGCSLIIPLDYVGGGAGNGGTGGTTAGHGGTTGGSHQGGSAAEAGAGEGGNGEMGGTVQAGSGGSSGKGGSGQGGGGRGGSTGGSEMGGTSGTVGGTAQGGEAGAGAEGGAGNGGASGGGTGGTSGGGQGGTAGGGRGGTSGGGQGGTAGGGMGGTGGCPFDTTSNPLHCGSCTNACPSGNECIDSKCVSSPCDELGCGSIQMAENNNGGMRKDAVGTTNDVCVEVPTYTPNTGFLPAINCWNVQNRTTTVNNVAVSCDNMDHPLAMPKRKGGYCFHAGPGNWDTTGFVMPFAPGGCCKAPTGGNGGTGGN